MFSRALVTALPVTVSPTGTLPPSPGFGVGVGVVEPPLPRNDDDAQPLVPLYRTGEKPPWALPISSTLAPLGKGLAAMVSGDLAALGRFTVVEREKLAVLLQEVQLGGALVDGVPLFDAATTPRAGRLLGARRLVQGGIQGTAAAGIDLDAGLTETATGAAAGTGADADGPLAELFRLERSW